jgi:uncharacterized protein YecT (DUF1311 family)
MHQGQNRPELGVGKLRWYRVGAVHQGRDCNAAVRDHGLLRARAARVDSILNDSFRRLRAKLEDKQVRKMRDMQRAWITSRDKSCEFLYDYLKEAWRIR